MEPLMITLNYLELAALKGMLEGALDHAKATPETVAVNRQVAIKLLEESIKKIDGWLSPAIEKADAARCPACFSYRPCVSSVCEFPKEKR